jgi:hypothetical protein
VSASTRTAALIRAGALRVQPCHVTIDLGDEGRVCWARPCPQVRAAAWRAWHAPGTVTTEDVRVLASAASALEELVRKPADERNAVVARMREAMRGDLDGEVEEEP